MKYVDMHVAVPVANSSSFTDETQSKETEEETEEEEFNSFWDHVKARLKAAQQWAKEVIASLTANHKGKAKQESDESESSV